ncbi:site-specific DNA-methyltransferase [Candidatus Amarolinea dominans]|uniref:site-specific DNA-methyltransferase n=1 Tax=Candidatus Amarolinea dominans TaxID=3140696 RepID=UPI001DBD9BA4|nr:site-specific DNA-methyltransferase [Anaerolineae bacterium]
MSKQTTSTTITALKHADKRVNIPTEELRDFVVDDEQAPKSLRYPRDPSLDPQLVWRGKDEQDAQDLAVPAVPIYIQEKIHPQSIINDLLAQAAKPGSALREAAASYQLNLFADFNGGPEEFDQKVEFYQHEQNWANRLILGDSLLVMASLAEKEGLRGKVQMIYLDPPYGIKFGSNWQVSTRKRDVKDGKAEDATRQPEQVRAFRDTWKLGIHSYLAYLRDRLVVARDLLTETGSVFVQIGDENVHLVRCVLDEVFGSENFVSLITFSKTSSATTELLAGTCDYIILYAKDRQKVKYRQLFIDKAIDGEGASAYDKIELADGRRLRLTTALSSSLDLSNARHYRLSDMRSQRPPGDFPVTFQGKTIRPISGYWKTGQDGFQRLVNARRIELSGNTLNYVRYLSDFPAFPITNIWNDVGSSVGGDKVYVVQTGTKIIERCLLMTTDPGDLVLDPTCGSGTTAYVAEQWGRRWITCDTSRVALALARTRLMAAKYPYYLLADSPDGSKKESELTGQMPPDYRTAGDIKKGFVYKRVPHVTLKSIANNPDIHEGMTRAEIDAAIARHTESETLYDQPYEDNKRVRVCGPFSVESLSPHRVLSTADEFADGALSEQEARQQQDFATMILDNLKKAGVQNTRKGERLTFDRLDPYPSAWLHASGEYTDAAGKPRRVAVSIGPEHGTVGPEQIKEAAKEAVQGVGFDMLVVCGFAFDPHVSEEVKRYGKLTVLPAKMNPDLAMGDELLKKTGAGNLFMVFGEPDVEIRRVRSDDFSRSATEVATTNQIVVEIKGVDVYDPTTGQIRSASTDDIACWFIDTDYNGESFFVRHAYFTGAEEPYDKLKRALRAEIDEAAWSVLYSTVSRPFAPPKSGKIAVKVINHYGDEVLKVFGV